ncbi:MAG: hypothetical protein QOD50_1372 [Actinomycetota bacterium]|jgi:CubicO group peptidase (beta-lactamase class C family)|nr:hypothetical protein [Actinomycetota bacterium]
MERTQALREHAARLGVTAAIVLAGGEEVVSVGSVSRPVPVHSLRKSLLSALYGQAHDAGLVDLRATLSELGIDETPPLSAQQKAATVEDLLTARSGVYPAAAGHIGVPGRPTRGTHPPGTHWLYNNWDFNVLGNIYERITHRSIYLAFDHEIAKPLGLIDWDLWAHGAYEYRDDILGGTQRYPNYTFMLSARDLTRVGELYRQRGHWNGHQLISESWIATSTQPHARTSFPPGLSGIYGYCWWVAGPESASGQNGIPSGTFSATGFGGNYLTVVPPLDAVVATTVDIPTPKIRDAIQQDGAQRHALADDDYAEFLRDVVKTIQ